MPTKLNVTETTRNYITLVLFGSMLISHGLGYGNYSLFHLTLIICLMNFKLQNLKQFIIEQKPLVFMLIYSTCSIWWSISPRAAKRETSIMAMGMAMFFFIVYSNVSTKQLLKILKIVMALCFFICIGESLELFRYPFSMYSTMAPLFKRTFVNPIPGVPTGFYYNPNNNALVILVFSPIIISTLERKLKLLYLAIASFIIFMASSKLILVAWILLLMILLVEAAMKKIGLTKLISIFAGIILLFSTLFYFAEGPRIQKLRKLGPTITTIGREVPSLISDRLMGKEVTFNFGLVDISIHERLLLLDGLVKVISEHWLFGVGGGSLEKITHTQQGLTLSLRMPHFYFLEIFAKYGLIFLTVYLFWIGQLFRRVLSLNFLYGLSLALFVIFCPVMSSATNFPPMWGLYALLMKLALTASEETESVKTR